MGYGFDMPRKSRIDATGMISWSAWEGTWKGVGRGRPVMPGHDSPIAFIFG
jgi:hypothetical protein